MKLNGKTMPITLVMLFAIFVPIASAQWSPGGMMVYMGDLNLAGASGSRGAAPYAIGSSLTVQAPLNNSSLNNSLINNSTVNSLPVLMPLDLSGYGSDRANKNLAGYKNIMYPMAESRGSTTTTGGASGGCCG